MIMKKAPLVSVLLCTYNDEKYISKTIDSILVQTYDNFEFIIINDGSNDSTRLIIESYNDPRIRLINKNNTGLIDSLNLGVLLCNGDYIARIDGDDMAMKERLYTQVKYMEEHRDCSVCGTNAVYINELGHKIGVSYLPENNDEIKAYSFFNSPIIHPSVMVRSSVLKENLYSSLYPVAEDYELWLRLMNDNIIFHNIPNPLLKYRIHKGNISRAKIDIAQGSFRRIYNNYFTKYLKEELRELYVDFVYNRMNTRLVSTSKFINYITSLELYNSRLFRIYLYRRWIGLCYHNKDYCSLFFNRFIKKDAYLYFKVFCMRILKRI